MEKLAQRAAKFMQTGNLEEGAVILQEIGLSIQGTPNLVRMKHLIKEAMMKPPYWKVYIQANKSLAPAKRISTKNHSSAKPSQKAKRPPRKKAKAPVDEKTLAFRIRKLATERALLSNQLKDAMGDTFAIKRNIAILDQIAPIQDEIEQMEEMKGKPLVPKTDNGATLVIIRKQESYTIDQLEAMTLDQLKGLKKRLQDDRRLAFDYANRAGKEKTRRANLEKESAKILEINLISNVITSKIYKARQVSANL